MELPLQSPAPKKPPHIKFMSDPCVEGLRSPNPARNPAAKDGEGKYGKEFLLSFRKIFTSAPPDLEKNLLDVGLQTAVTSTPVKRLPGGRVHISVTRIYFQLQQAYAKTDIPKYKQATTWADTEAQRKSAVSFLQKRTYERLVVMENNVRMQQKDLVLREAEFEQERMALDQQKESEKQMAIPNQEKESLGAQKMQITMEVMALDKQKEDCVQRQADPVKQAAVSDQETMAPGQESSKLYPGITNAQKRLDSMFAGAGTSGFVYITGVPANVSHEDVIKIINEISGKTIHVSDIFAEGDCRTVLAFFAEQEDGFWGGKSYVTKELEAPEISGNMRVHFVRNA